MFKDNLVVLRKRAGLSQEALAHAIGVTRQSISKYETGTAEPDFTRLAQLRDYFEVSYDALLGEGQGESVSLPITGSITIQSAIDGRMTQFDMFTIATVLGYWRKNAPQAQLVGEMAKNNNGFLGPDVIPLGWYATRQDAEKEVTAVQAAISHGRGLYKLQYNAKVLKHGLFGWKIES